MIKFTQPNWYQTAGMALLMLSINAEAAMPTPVLPTTDGATAGNWLSILKAYAHTGLTIIGLILGTVAFIWVGWITIAKFNEARNGRSEWAEVGVTAVMAGGVMLFVGYMLTEADKVMGAAGAVVGG